MNCPSILLNSEIMKHKPLGIYVLLKDLQNALKNNELLLLYQPKINGKTGKLVGLEALVRWKHPVYGLLSPSEFLPLAQETGIINRLDNWVLNNACNQIKYWQGLGYTGFRLAVNQFSGHFKEDILQERVMAVLKTTGIDPSCLELEIIEECSRKCLNHPANILRRLANIGVKITIDNFGIGCSSLYNLKRLSANYLKIDRSLILDILNDKSSLAIVKAFIGIAHALNLKAIAQGVESKEQFVLLQSMDCDELQGFYISKPLTVREVGKYFKTSL